jgi:drug/metabolite transporter (DMT)-like permease
MNTPLIVWLILCLICGSTWIFIKLGLRDLPPITFAGPRFLFASAILWAIVFARRRPLPNNRGDWLKLAWVGVFAHVYLPNERVTARKLLGAAIGVADVSLIFYDQMKIEGVAALRGSVALVLSSVCVAYTNVFIKARCRCSRSCSISGW